MPPLASPSWDSLYETASAQEGLFSTRQAARAGYSPQLLAKHLRSGRIHRVRRGVYRLKHFPAGEHEDLVAIWLWSEQQGVFSHETALGLQDLSDVMPARAHLNLPASWKGRRLRVPDGVSIAFADVAAAERAWVGSVPVTGPKRTLFDCVQANLSPEIVEKAMKDASARGLLASSDRRKLEAALRARRRAKR